MHAIVIQGREEWLSTQLPFDPYRERTLEVVYIMTGRQCCQVQSSTVIVPEVVYFVNFSLDPSIVILNVVNKHRMG